MMMCNANLEAAGGLVEASSLTKQHCISGATSDIVRGVMLALGTAVVTPNQGEAKCPSDTPEPLP